MTKRFLTANEVIAQLGISKGTLYSYVSRGLIRSEETVGKTRARRYDAEDVARLQQRKAQRRNPAQSAAAALHFGDPVLESAITLITDNHLYYRGYDAIHLATATQFEQVALLLWRDELPATPPALPRLHEFPPSARTLVDDLLRQQQVAEALQVSLMAAAPIDLAAYNLRDEAVAQTGLRILALLTDAITGMARVDQALSTAEQLQRAWAPEQPTLTRLLNAALILCADHELNASSFTARCIASTGATPYSALIGALAALQGYKHGGATREVAHFLHEAAAAPTQALREQLQRGRPVPGFGHRLYAVGDPRATALLALARQVAPRAAVWRTVDPLLTLMVETTQQRPNIDFALVVMAQSVALPTLAPFTLFALGRTAGWIAHSAEQYSVDRLIRPRANYNGRAPERD